MTGSVNCTYFLTLMLHTLNNEVQNMKLQMLRVLLKPTYWSTLASPMSVCVESRQEDGQARTLSIVYSYCNSIHCNSIHPLIFSLLSKKVSAAVELIMAYQASSLRCPQARWDMQSLQSVLGLHPGGHSWNTSKGWCPECQNNLNTDERRLESCLLRPERFISHRPEKNKQTLFNH